MIPVRAEWFDAFDRQTALIVELNPQARINGVHVEYSGGVHRVHMTVDSTHMGRIVRSIDGTASDYSTALVDALNECARQAGLKVRR